MRCFFLENMLKPTNLKKTKRIPNPVNLTKKEFAVLDVSDLLCEISILSNCDWLGCCRVYRICLKWCVELAKSKWDTEKYVHFDDVLVVVRKHRKFFRRTLKFEYNRKEKIIDIISKKK